MSDEITVTPSPWPKLLLGAFFAFCILPFLVLCLFAHPSADDWYMAANGRDLGFWASNIKFYNQVTGRFTSSLLLHLHPMLVSIALYKAVCALVVAGLLVALQRALRAWFPAAGWHFTWAGALAALGLLVWAMPSPAQGFYWVTGISIYTLAGVLALCLAAVLGRQCLDAEHKPSTPAWIAAPFLALIIPGFTEVGMALVLLHLLVLNTWYFWQNRKLSVFLLIVLAAAAIGSAIVILAPGNAWRLSQYSSPVQRELLPSLILSAKLAVTRGLGWLTLAPFALTTLLIMSVWPFDAKPTRRQAWEHLGFALILIVGTVWGGLFIGAWSAGKLLPPRALNLVYLFLIVDWAVLVSALSLLLRAYSLQPPRFNLPAAALIVLALGAALLGPNHIKQAWKDLLSGKALRYDRECLGRYELIRKSTTEEVAVPALEAKPKSLFFNDLGPTPDDWRNTGCAQFFRKKSITLQ